MDQTTQALCHILVVNACVPSTTGYLEHAIDAQEADGASGRSDQLEAHISPALLEAINHYGAPIFDIAGVLKRSRRPFAASKSMLVDGFVGHFGAAAQRTPEARLLGGGRLTPLRGGGARVTIPVCVSQAEAEATQSSTALARFTTNRGPDR